MDRLPSLRADIDIVPVRHDGKEFFVVRDSLGIVAEGLALRAEMAPLLAWFDGRHTPADLLQALTGTGKPVSPEDVETLVSQLDSLGILHTERYLLARREAVATFAAAAYREAALAGSAYPAGKGALAAHIDDILAAAAPGLGSGEPPVGLVAPHIDLAVSKSSYAAAYGALGKTPPSAILLLGTGHALERPFSLTAKTFRTPLGEVAADGDACRRLSEAGGGALAPDDFAHRGEHSLEFQLLFLHRLFPMETIPIIPLLCGSFDPYIRENRDPMDDPGIAGLVGGLRDWLDGGRGGRIVVAGVDFSHVGPKFGDADDARSVETEFRDFDDKLLKALEGGDRKAFFEHGVTSGNCYKVCGFSALYTLMAVLPEAKGATLDYQVWHEEATRSAVSFAAVALA